MRHDRPKFKGVANANDNRIVNLGAPVEQTDAARLQDVTGGGTGGFYGITVAHSDDSTVHRGINTLKFNVESFYITQNSPNTDESLVNFRETSVVRTGSITVERVKRNDDIIFFFTPVAITIDRVYGVLRGSETPEVHFYLRHDPDRTAVGESVIGEDTGPLSSTTTVQDFDLGAGDPTVPEGSWIWLETTAKSGTIREMNLTIRYTED